MAARTPRRRGLRIATFNVNGVRARLDAVTGWLEAYRPDVLALQETKVVDELFPAEAFEAAGYHAVFRGEKGYNGVALLSRRPLAGVRFGFDDGGPADEPRLVQAEIDGITLLNTYVPQGRDIEHLMYAYKIEWLARVRAHLERHADPARPLLWLGDLNVAAEPMDVHNPQEREEHVCFHIRAREAFARTRAWGVEDVLRRFHPGPGIYTFYDYRSRDPVGTNRGWRIDYLLASPPLAARARRCEVDLGPRRAARPSDHVPLWADFA